MRTFAPRLPQMRTITDKEMWYVKTVKFALVCTDIKQLAIFNFGLLISFSVLTEFSLAGKITIYSHAWIPHSFWPHGVLEADCVAEL